MLTIIINKAYQAAHPPLKQDDGKSERYMRISISFVDIGRRKSLGESSERLPFMAANVVQSNLP